MKETNLSLLILCCILAGVISVAFINLGPGKSPTTAKVNFQVAKPSVEKDNSNRNIPFQQIMVDPFSHGRLHCKTVGDIDGDGYPDILAGDDAGQGVFWYKWPEWSKHRIDIGRFTTDMQVGDIDGDGDLDVIIPQRNGNLVWYENPRPAGDPAIDPWKVHIVDTEGAHDVEVGDINGNGKLDIVVRSKTTRVYWQISPDDWSKTVIKSGGRGGTVLGDLDRDGDLDIAQNGYWLENPGKPGKDWQRHEIAAGWPNDIGVHIADVNGDGWPDVLMAHAEESGKLVWYEAKNAKKGPWREHVIDGDISHIHTFKAADVDGDGNLDVVISEMEQSPQRRVIVYYNTGGKGLEWQPQVISRYGSHNIRVVDIGNDGDIDIIGANHGNQAGPSGIVFWENLTEKPTPRLALDKWQRHVIDADRPWKAVFIDAADLDGDGKKDIVTGGWWYKNPGTAGGGWARNVIGDPLENFALVYDFDGDGNLDLLGHTGKNNQELLARGLVISWARNDGRGAFNVMTNIPAGDGDFLQGIGVVRPGIGGQIKIALSWHRGSDVIEMLTIPRNPAEGTWNSHKISGGSQLEQISVGHITSHRSLDIALGTKWLRSKGDDWELHTLHEPPGDPDRNRLADMNGNGRLDVVVGYEAINKPGKLAWYECPEDPTGMWKEHIISTEVVGPMSVGVADIDRDGDMDVVVGEHNYKQPETAKLHIYENVDGRSTHWKDHVISEGDEHHDGAVVVDIDNDGDFDIISIGWSHPKVLVYENLAQ